MRITFFAAKSYDKDSFNKIKDQYPELELEYWETELSPKTASYVQDSEAICAFVSSDVSEKTIRALSERGVKLILMRCAGFNNVDLEAATKYGITVMRVPGYSPEAVAEHAMALAMAVNRHLHKSYMRVRENNFSLVGLTGVNFSGKTAGIVGTGKIARELIRILKGFGMEVLAYDIYPDPEYAVRAQIEYVSLDELYRRSDIISLHCPLTDATRYMIDGAAIGRMKPGVMLINTGRGQLIHTEALIEGLKEKKIGAAGLDVYEEEAAYFYEDTSDRIMDDDVLARLLSFNNVVMTSHQGFFTREALDNIAHTTLQNINDFAVHRELRNEVRAEPEKTMN